MLWLMHYLSWDRSTSICRFILRRYGGFYKAMLLNEAQASSGNRFSSALAEPDSCDQPSPDLNIQAYDYRCICDDGVIGAIFVRYVEPAFDNLDIPCPMRQYAEDSIAVHSIRI